MTTRVLMVDDEIDAQELFRQNFRREIRKGVYAFDFALSGEDALQILHHGTPPEVLVLLSDINMPGMSGVELLEEVQKTWPDIRVFMITAYGDAATQTQVEEMGASQFFTKPVDFARLKIDLAVATGASA
ncbi:MAG: response regulator [Pseudomonadota bacterium]